MVHPILLGRNDAANRGKILKVGHPDHLQGGAGLLDTGKGLQFGLLELELAVCSSDVIDFILEGFEFNARDRRLVNDQKIGNAGKDDQRKEDYVDREHVKTQGKSPVRPNRFTMGNKA